VNKIYLTCLGGFLAWSAAASADVTGVVTGDGVKVALGGASPYSLTGQNVADQINASGTNEYGNYQISTSLQQDDIVFANNATTEGNLASVTTSTSIAVTIKNTGNLAVIPQLQSEIAPGGFGSYVAEPESNPTQSSTTGIIGDINQTPQGGNQSFADFFPRSGQVLAGATFSLVIASDGTPIATFSGAFTLSAPNTTGAPPIVTVTGGTGLNGFGLITPVGDASAVGYQWDATNVFLTLPGTLDPGASQTITYDTTVTAFSSAETDSVVCGNYESCPTLQSYSGFGDPIGKGKGGTPPAAAALAALAGGVSPFDDSGISGVYFPRFELSVPTFNSATGMLSVPLVTDPSTGEPMELPSLPLSSTAVPEPQTWALMLLGAALTGSAARRRRVARRRA
jgi:hypothetical protein